MFIVIVTWERGDGDGLTSVYGPFRSVADANARANAWAAAAKNSREKWAEGFAYFKAIVRPLNVAQWELPTPST